MPRPVSRLLSIASLHIVLYWKNTKGTRFGVVLWQSLGNSELWGFTVSPTWDAITKRMLHPLWRLYHRVNRNIQIRRGRERLRSHWDKVAVFWGIGISAPYKALVMISTSDAKLLRNHWRRSSSCLGDIISCAGNDEPGIGIARGWPQLDKTIVMAANVHNTVVLLFPILLDRYFVIGYVQFFFANEKINLQSKRMESARESTKEKTVIKFVTFLFYS